MFFKFLIHVPPRKKSNQKNETESRPHSLDIWDHISLRFFFEVFADFLFFLQEKQLDHTFQRMTQLHDDFFQQPNLTVFENDLHNDPTNVKSKPASLWHFWGPFGAPARFCYRQVVPKFLQKGHESDLKWPKWSQVDSWIRKSAPKIVQKSFETLQET